MQNTSRCIASLAFLAASIVAQNDLHVGGTNPGAYQTVDAAYAAAQPGDRILIHTGHTNMGMPVITKSVTFEATALGVFGFTQLGWGNFNPDRVDITQLTPVIPLTFRNIRFDYYNITSRPPSISGGSLNGEIRFESCRFTFHGGSDVPWMLELAVARAHFSNCIFENNGTYADFACWSSNLNAMSGGCLRITCDRLVMEDCNLRAASGAYARSSPDNCSNNCGFMQTRPTPFGGFAIQADSRETWMVRCRTSDGNGGGAEAPVSACASYGIPSPAGVSHFTSATGQLHAYDFVHQSGLHGQYAGPGDGPRGPLTQIGEATAPLRLLGNAQLGGGIQASVSEPGISLLAMAFAWSPTNTPVGRIAFDPLQQHFTFVVFTPNPPSTQSWNVPNDPFLNGLPIVTQLFPFDPTSGAWRASNPSGIFLQRP